MPSVLLSTKPVSQLSGRVGLAQELGHEEPQSSSGCGEDRPALVEDGWGLITSPALLFWNTSNQKTTEGAERELRGTRAGHRAGKKVEASSGGNVMVMMLLLMLVMMIM